MVSDTPRGSVLEPIKRVSAPAESRDDFVERLLVSHAADAERLAAWILRDPVGAEDVVQHAALLAWKQRSSLRDAASAPAWFQRIVVNTCRDELRRRGRVRDLPLGEPVEPPSSDSVAERDELERAVSRLAPDEQIVLALRFGRDLTVPAIARGLGVPEGTIKSRLHHALEHLRAALAAERRSGERQ